jgi:apolipoprotein N-acyltransferase
VTLPARLVRAGFPGWRAAGLDLLAGAAVSLAQAPLLAWYLAFPALVWALARMLRPAGRAGAFWAGWFVGAGYFGGWLNWIVSPFFVDPVRHGWMAPFAFVLMAFGLGLFWALAAALAARLPRRALALAAALAAVELARGHLFTGFPWAQLGQIWLGGPVEQLAAWIGATGLTVATPALAALPLAAGRAGALGAALALSGALLAGQIRAAAPDPAPSGDPARAAVSLRLVQPNAEQSLKWDPDQALVLFRRQLQMTAEGTPADLTIWPETAVPYLLERSPEVAGLIARASGGRPVMVGIQRVEGQQVWNSLAVIRGEGEVGPIYDKHHLVPFGEYLPLGDLLLSWFGITAFAAQAGQGYSAGPGPQVLDLGPALGRVLPLICYEAVFPGIPRAAPQRPDWMVQITNDAWFGTLTGPFQHFQQARLRAIEMGLPLLRVANTGVTAVIDARGRVLQRLEFGTAGALDVAGLPPALAPTPYARAGDLPALALLAGLAGLALLAAPGRRPPARPASA